MVLPRLDVLLLLALAGCDQMIAPETYRPFTPPPAYATWLEETEACVGQRAPVGLGELRFYSVPGASWYSEEHGKMVVGIYDPENTIYLAEARVYDRGIVTHEFVHLITQDSGHPVPPFGVCAPYGG